MFIEQQVTPTEKNNSHHTSLAKLLSSPKTADICLHPYNLTHLINTPLSNIGDM